MGVYPQPVVRNDPPETRRAVQYRAPPLQHATGRRSEKFPGMSAPLYLVLRCSRWLCPECRSGAENKGKRTNVHILRVIIGHFSACVYCTSLWPSVPLTVLPVLAVFNSNSLRLLRASHGRARRSTSCVTLQNKTTKKPTNRREHQHTIRRHLSN